MSRAGAMRIASPRLRELASRLAPMPLWSAKAAPEEGLLPATRQRAGRGDANATALPAWHLILHDHVRR